MIHNELEKAGTETNYTYSAHFLLKSSSEIFKIPIHFCKYGDYLNNVEGFLHDDEHAYFQTLAYERRRTSYLLGRYSAKKAISGLMGEDNPKKIRIENGIFNQPVAVCESNSNLQVSLTHCDELAAAVAFPEMLVIGIDMEKIDLSMSSGVEAELTEHEKELALQLPCPYENLLMVLWTMKESLSKVLKTGLTVPLRVLEVKWIEVQNGYYIGSFSNFAQYNSISFPVKDYVYSITYPKNAEIEIDIHHIKSNLHKML